MSRLGINAHQLATRMAVSPQTTCNWRDGRKPMRVYEPLLVRALAEWEQQPAQAPAEGQQAVPR